MKPLSVIAAIMRNLHTYFNVSYAYDYKTFILQHVLADRTHPLNETQRRRQRERTREGLWWHVTTSADLSKSSCVRAWARRRLRNAVVEELKLRGYDDTGKPLLLDETTKTNTALPPKPIRPAKPDLTGSLRLHIQAPLIPAKFPAVRAEVSTVIDQLVRAANIPVGSALDKKTQPVPQNLTKPPGNRAPYVKPRSTTSTTTTRPPPRKTTNAQSNQPRFSSFVPQS